MHAFFARVVCVCSRAPRVGFFPSLSKMKRLIGMFRRVFRSVLLGRRGGLGRARMLYYSYYGK